VLQFGVMQFGVTQLGVLQLSMLQFGVIQFGVIQLSMLQLSVASMTADLCPYRTVSFTGSPFYRSVLFTEPISLQLSVGYGKHCVPYRPATVQHCIPNRTAYVIALYLLQHCVLYRLSPLQRCDPYSSVTYSVTSC
jgi:hypothetical protein